MADTSFYLIESWLKHEDVFSSGLCCLTALDWMAMAETMLWFLERPLKKDPILHNALTHNISGQSPTTLQSAFSALNHTVLYDYVKY